jgi:hypothetical protein
MNNNNNEVAGNDSENWAFSVGLADGLYLGNKYHYDMLDRSEGSHDVHWYKRGYDAGVSEYCLTHHDDEN